MPAETAVVIESIVTYGSLGAMWNLGNVSFKKLTSGSEKMIWRRLVQAIVLGAGAGLLVGLWGQPAEPGMFEVAMATIVPLADKAYNAYNAGIEAYNEADDVDGDGPQADEVRAAVKEGFAELMASDPELPDPDGPQQDPDDVDPETGAPIDMSVDDEPTAEQIAEKRREAPTGDDVVQSGP